MIEQLYIRDFALVDDLRLHFGSGLNAITGETGAGKSILLQALGLLLGERANRESVRAGAAQARVEGVFAPSGSAQRAIADTLCQAGVVWDAEDPLLVSRVVGADGRSRAFVNGSGVPSSLLGRVGRNLVEFSGQHQHQGLLREDTHLGLLDAALTLAGQRTKVDYVAAYRRWHAAEQLLSDLQGKRDDGREREDLLRHQCAEIRGVELQPGEDAELRREREVLAHAGKLQEAYGAAEAELYSASDAALERLGRALRAVEGARERDPEAAPILDLLYEARSCVEEAALALRGREAALAADPLRLDRIEERLDRIQRLERKYGAGSDTLVERLAAMEQELEELEGAEFALEDALRERDAARQQLQTAGQQLAAAREQAARELTTRVNRELADLALGGAAFQVQWVPTDPGPEGSAGARFLLAANPGEPPKALARVASGGELSRILLALKNALRDTGVETLVFDEVDAGIGGVTAEAVGERLAQLAERCQVLVITHLAQVAPRARHHLRVAKRVVDGRTVTEVQPLDRQQRVAEVARMMTGSQVTRTTLEHAQELLERYAQ